MEGSLVVVEEQKIKGKGGGAQSNIKKKMEEE